MSVECLKGLCEDEASRQTPNTVHELLPVQFERERPTSRSFSNRTASPRDLAAVQAKLRGWSASLSRMGAGAYGGELPGPLAAIARFASSPAGMFAGLLTAAKMTATAGDEIVHLAEKAGTSVEAISSLAYAARRAEVNADSLATGRQEDAGQHHGRRAWRQRGDRGLCTPWALGRRAWPAC